MAFGHFPLFIFLFFEKGGRGRVGAPKILSFLSSVTGGALHLLDPCLCFPGPSMLFLCPWECPPTPAASILDPAGHGKLHLQASFKSEKLHTTRFFYFHLRCSLL